MRALALLLCTSLLLSCSEPSSPPKTEFNREGVEIQLTVKTFKNRDELNRYLRSRKGQPDEPSRGRAIYSPHDTKCELFIVQNENWAVDDEAALTKGHELRHCLYGDYHDPVSL